MKRLLLTADATHASLFAREGTPSRRSTPPHRAALSARARLAPPRARRRARPREPPRAPGPPRSPTPYSRGDGGRHRARARALDALHTATGPDQRPLGLVHRDVSPGNVLLGRDGAVKLTDLGVVRTAATDAATVAGVKGTLAYMAPEQLHGRAAGPAADLYGAALVAYEALTGAPRDRRARSGSPSSSPPARGCRPRCSRCDPRSRRRWRRRCSRPSRPIRRRGQRAPPPGSTRSSRPGPAGPSGARGRRRARGAG
ncbi:MAG: protein kinase [Deltaproteobacteria bacterium]|nr:protein kinase [Deltaproteobacteria bacterium]